MPAPTGYTEWGYLGGLIFIVVSFLVYLIRRDGASAKREEKTQEFFGKLFAENKGATAELAEVIRKLVEKFDEHSMETAEAIAMMRERTNPKTQPRPRPKAGG